MKQYLLLLLGLFLPLTAHAQFSLSLNRAQYEPGEPIIATWTGRTDGAGTDWIGIYPRDLDGVPDGSPGSSTWLYVNGTRSATDPLAAGSVTFINHGLGVRQWTAFFLINDGYETIGRVDFEVVGDRDALGSFSLNKPVYRPGEAITASWANRTNPVPTDWVGIYPRSLDGVPDGDPVSTTWLYVNGTQNATTPLGTGSVTFAAPTLPVGEWRAYFLINDGYESLAIFDFEVVLPPIAGFMADHLFINDGVPITLSWVVNAPPEGLETLSLTGGPAALNVTGQDTLEVSPTQTTQFTLTMNGTRTATAWIFKAVASSPAFSVPSSVMSSSVQVPVTWNIPAAAADSWIGIWPAGSDPSTTPPAQRLYLNGTATAGGNHPAGTLAFTLPEGAWFAMLFSTSQTMPSQGPLRFDVVPGPLAPLALASYGMSGNDFMLSWISQPARNYEVRSSPDLSSWFLEATVPASSATTSHYLTPQGPKHYYQVREKNAP